MDDDKWITVDKRSKRLVIRFRVKGYRKQFYIASGLKDTNRNREIVRLKRDAISTDILLDRFDESLDSYQFKLKNIKPALIVSVKKYEYNLSELWDKFTQYKTAFLEKTTLAVKYRAVERYIAKLPDCSLDNAVECRNWMLNNISLYMTYENLASFKSCCDWAVNSKLIPDNPYEKLTINRPKRIADEDFRAFTVKQRDIIINAFESHRKHSSYAPLIKLLFWTGCRLGEAFALTWGDISDDCTKISITKSCNMFGIKKGTKNNKKRIFPTQENSKLHSLLLEIKPVNYKKTDLIFRSKTGAKINSDIVQNFWNESIGSSGHKYPGVVRELVNQGHIPRYLKPYSTRHTFITWAITYGISPDKVALWVGDEVTTILKNYCHPNVVDASCPDF
jgi:integrase